MLKFLSVLLLLGVWDSALGALDVCLLALRCCVVVAFVLDLVCKSRFLASGNLAAYYELNKYIHACASFSSACSTCIHTHASS